MSFRTTSSDISYDPLYHWLLSQILLNFWIAWITHMLENFVARLSARVTFQLTPQPLDILIFLTWHSTRMSLFYCSLTGIASNWDDRLPQIYRNDFLFFTNMKEKTCSQKHAFQAQLWSFSGKQKADLSVRHYALTVETHVGQGTINIIEYPSTINFACNPWSSRK